MKNADKPINPITRSFQEENDFVNKWTPLIGLTKREYFAGLAMQGMLSNSEWRTTLDIETNTVERALIRDSIKYANELLKQLEEK